MDWSIQEVARLAGATSRTLRHYGDVGLLPASRIGANGYRYYDRAGACAAAADIDAPRPRPRHPGNRRGAQQATGRHSRPGQSPALARAGERTSRSAGSPQSRPRSSKWKEVNNSWQKKCLTASTTPSTRMRSPSAGARRRTPTPTTGGGPSRPAERAEWQQAQKRLAADWQAAAASGNRGRQRGCPGPGSTPGRLARIRARNSRFRYRQAREGILHRAWRDVRGG